MAITKIDGKDSLLLFLDLTYVSGSPSYDGVVCLTNVSYGVTNNAVDANSKCGPDKRPGTQDFPLDFEGQYNITPGVGELSGTDLYDAAKNQTTVAFKIAQATPAQGSPVIEGIGFISDFQTDSPEDAVVTFTGSIAVQGIPDQTVTP